MAKKRMTIIDAENEFEKDGAILTGTGTAAPTSSLTGPSSILFKYDASVTREIQSKERVWRNRSTILVSTGKVGLILQNCFNYYLYINHNNCFLCSYFSEFCQINFSHYSSN